jgi:hypothetical protein
MNTRTFALIEAIFTIDYEIYGNGEGSLEEMVYGPAEKLIAIFRRRNTRFVPFVEVAELEMIAAKGTDQAIALVERQIRDFYKEGFELGLHIHPQWYRARFDAGRWRIDYTEYNLCTLPRQRMAQIVDRAIDYLRKVLGDNEFTPLSFRAGNWLFQPTRSAGEVLAERGIRVDSSVFKGGLQHQHNLDYRRALKNGYYWKFGDSVEVSDPNGNLLELPIYTQMIPFWKMLTAKRIGIQRKSPSTSPNGRQGLNRFLDYLRLWYPIKFDFCRMTISELKRMLDALIREDQENPALYRPIVAIGHTKDLVDFETVELFLSYLEQKKIPISTFSEILPKCNPG